MTAVTQSEFARLMGVNRSTVSRTWKGAGRLVMQGDLVDVEASRARIKGTADPNRDDVAARHAAARPPESTPSAPPPAAQSDDRIGNSYQAARAIKEKYAALAAKADYERTIGQLIPRADVQESLDDLVAFARTGIENLPHRVASQLVGKDYETIIATLRQEVVALMADMHKGARQQLAALTQGEGVV